MGAAINDSFFYEFVTLFVILDPIATLPIFVAVSGGLSRRQSLGVAASAVGVSFLVLFFFIVFGERLLEALKISIPTFQLAGSIVLLLFSLNMVLGKVTRDAAAMPPQSTMVERAIHPLAIPGIAGPGSMLTVVLLTDSSKHTFTEQVQTTGIVALCLLVLFIAFALASVILRVLGRSGAEVVSRVFGLVLASIAVNGLVASIKLTFLS